MSPSPSPPDIALSCENVSYRSSRTPNACSLPITKSSHSSTKSSHSSPNSSHLSTKSAIIPITNPSTRAPEPCSSNTSIKSRAPVSSLVYPDKRLLSHLDWDWTLLSIILTWLFGLTIQAPEQSKRNKLHQSKLNELEDESKRNAPDQSNRNELKKSKQNKLHHSKQNGQNQSKRNERNLSKRNKPDQSKQNASNQSKRNEPIHSKRKEKLKHILLVITKLFLCQGWLAVITIYSISDVLLTKIDYSSLLNFQNVGNFFAIFQLSWWSGAVIPLLICWYWQATGMMSIFLTQLNTYRQKYGPTVAATSKSKIAFYVIGIAQMLLFWISYLVLFCFKSLRSCERTSITKSYKELGIPAFFWLSTACLVFPVISNLCFQSVGEVVDEFQEVVEEIQTTSTTPTPSVIHRLVERYWYILEMVEVLGRMLSLYMLLTLTAFVPSLCLLSYIIYIRCLLCSIENANNALNMLGQFAVELMVVCSLIISAARLSEKLADVTTTLVRWREVIVNDDIEVGWLLNELKRLLRGLLGFGKHGHAPDLCGFGVLSKGLLLTITSFVFTYVILLVQFADKETVNEAIIQSIAGRNGISNITMIQGRPT